MKLTNLLLIALLGIIIPAQLPAMAASHSAPVTAQQTVYLFDYHDVIANENRQIAYDYIRTSINRRNFPAQAFYFFRILGSILAYGINRVMPYNKRYLCMERAALYGFSGKPLTNQNYVNYALHILNPFTTNQEVLDFADQLKAAGSQVFLFSNIGQQSFNFMEGPTHIDTRFNGKYICNDANNFTTKRSPEAFKLLLKQQILPKYQAQHGADTYPKRIVMIDDSPKKIAAAKQGLKELQAIPGYLVDMELISVVFKDVAQMQIEVQTLTQTA